MIRNRRNLVVVTAILLALSFSAVTANAQRFGEYKAVVRHLQSSYQAKKVRVPFMWLARAAVRVVRPAGVKSFNVTMFKDLQFSRENLDKEMQMTMRNSFGPEWSPIFHVRSREGQQAYMYMREDGDNVKIALVTIDKGEAAVIRAKFSPEKLAEFINNPKIFGIDLGDNDEAKNKDADPSEVPSDN